jgi:hypothetical protein
MANRACLWSGEQLPPEWTYSEDRVGARPLLGADYLIPLFWLCLFRPDDIGSYHDPDGDSLLPWRNRVPYLAAPREQCVTTFSQRVAHLRKILASTDYYLPKWQDLLNLVQTPYLSVDFSEVFWMAPESQQGVLAALESLAGDDATPSAALLRVTSLVDVYKQATRDFEPDGERFKKFEYVVGYRLDAPLDWFSA